MANLKTYNVGSSEVDLDQLTKKLKGSVYELGGLLLHEGVLTVLGTSITDETALDAEVNTHIPVEVSPLRVHRVLPTKRNPLISDFTILGFRKVSPSYERGRKTRALYKCATTEDIIVEKVFNDVRDVNGVLTDLEITFNWYDEADSIGLTKTEKVKSFNKYQAETEERERRERQIDYLVAGAKGTPIEANIAAIFELLYTQVQAYKEQADPAPMVNALDSIIYDPNAATQEELEMNGMWYVLNAIALPRVDDPNKVIYVIQSIKYQIGAMTLAEIEAANV